MKKLTLVLVMGLLGCSRPSVLGLATQHVGEPLPRAKAVVVLLHGFGAPGNDLVGLAQELHATAPPGTAFVIPEAPHTAGGGLAWFKKPEQVADVRARLQRLLTGVMKDAHVEPSRVVVGGFSQGAMMAADVALHASKPLGGVIMFSGKEVPNGDWAARAPNVTATWFFISHGTGDGVIPLAAGVAVKTLLEGAGVPVTYVEFNGAHRIAPEARQGAAAFLSSVLAR